MLCLVRKDKRCLHDILSQTAIYHYSSDKKIVKSKRSIGLVRFISISLAVSIVYYSFYSGIRSSAQEIQEIIEQFNSLKKIESPDSEVSDD